MEKLIYFVVVVKGQFETYVIIDRMLSIVR